MRKLLRAISVILLLVSAVLTIPSSADAYVSVKGYTKKNGTYVAPYVRSNPNGLKYDNYSYKPSQGLYNPSYGTKGSTWDTPTFITDPSYYQGKAIYDGLNSGSSVAAPSFPAVVQPQLIAPLNSTSYGTFWLCNYGYKQVGNSCEQITAPLNATLYGTTWFCDSGYTKVGDSCVPVYAPPSTYYVPNSACANGYRYSGGECLKIEIPLNAHLSSYATQGWWCDAGFQQKGNSCNGVSVPVNAEVAEYTVDGWVCKDGFRKINNGCIR